MQIHFPEMLMSGTVLAEAGWHMEAVLEGSAPAGGIKQPEVEGPGIDARVFAIGWAELLVFREGGVQEDDGAGGSCHLAPRLVAVNPLRGWRASCSSERRPQKVRLRLLKRGSQWLFILPGMAESWRRRRMTWKPRRTENAKQRQWH